MIGKTFFRVYLTDFYPVTPLRGPKRKWCLTFSTVLDWSLSKMCLRNNLGLNVLPHIIASLYPMHLRFPPPNENSWSPAVCRLKLVWNGLKSFFIYSVASLFFRSYFSFPRMTTNHEDFRTWQGTCWIA